jgi:eukaryotic-like serine/threonine-protein kinase
LEKLGSTREGPLYRAEFPTGLEVALVVLGPESGGHEPSVDSGPLAYQHQRFQQVAQIRHVNVAAVHEMGEIPDGPGYVVLECLAGKPLSQILAERGVLPPDEAVDLVLQAAAGLEAAHQVGLVHANLSPDSILVTRTPDGPLVKLIGFALVSCLQPALEKPIDREVGVEYASPERLAGYVPDKRSDVFSLGAVLHHLLVGVPPSFGSEGLVSVVMRAPVAKALLPIPGHRFQTMSEFAGAVKHAATVATRSKRARTRRALLLTTGGIIPLVAAGVWLFASLQGRGPGAGGPAQERGARSPASGVPAEGTETGSRLLVSGAEEGREAPSEEAAYAGSTPSDSLRSPAPVPTETDSAAATGANKVRQEKLAALRAAAAATAKRAEERRRRRAEAAARALNGDRQIQTTQPSSVSREGPAGDSGVRDSGAVSTPPPASPGSTLEEQAQVSLRIGLDEASRQLGGPAHAIEGMSPLFMGLARGRFPEGADPTMPLVRGVYLDPNGGLILLDQQRIRSGTRAPAATGTRWRIGDIMLYLHGESRPAMLRNLARQVR